MFGRIHHSHSRLGKCHGAAFSLKRSGNLKAALGGAPSQALEQPDGAALLAGREPPPWRSRHAAGARGLSGASSQAGSSSCLEVSGTSAPQLAEVPCVLPAYHLQISAEAVSVSCPQEI